MKFNCLIKITILIVLICYTELTGLNQKRPVTLGQMNSLKTDKINGYRFQDYDKMNKDSKKNLIMMNSEILNSKPPTSNEDFETDVYPSSANAGSEFKWSFLWWTVMHFPAKNALKTDLLYWLSARNRKHDHWEAVFDVPQKIDTIDIHWRLPPKRFRVFFKLDDSSDYIPATSVHEKQSFLTKEGKVSKTDAVSEYNTVIFNKPIFAKRIRINLNEPLKNHSFSIFSVKFYQRRTTMLIKNELIDPTQHYCLYVNTNVPRPGSKVEVYPCLKALALANNNELWVSYTDNSIRHYNSKLCLGFDIENLLTLKKCDEYNPAFTVQLRNDGSLFFTGYKDKCIVVDNSKKLSENFISTETEIFVTSEADRQSFKKENIKITGENYWHSVPGQKKASIQILFGKILKGPNKGKYENKKIDTIKIDWIKEPKKFMVYTWKPGFSWTLKYVYTNYREKKSVIDIIGEDAAAIMLVLEESHSYDNLNNLPAYAIREVSIMYQSMKVKNANCANYNNSVKIFDFDTQNYHKLENVKDYIEVRKSTSISFEKIVGTFNQLKMSQRFVEKSKSKALDIIKKLNKIKKVISDQTIKKLRTFKSEEISKIKNSVFESYLASKNAHAFLNGIKHKRTGTPVIGSKIYPAQDCLTVKKFNKNALSGWYYIKPECSPISLRVFCDFTIYKDATDIYIFNDNNKEPNPDLSYLKIKDFNSIRYQCAKLGLYPLEINNSQTVERVYQLLTSSGYDLSKSIAVPLGYDYSCGKGKCSGIANSLNDKQTPVIISYFRASGSSGRGLVVKPGPFVGIGYSNTHTMLKFSHESAIISAIICSTNHFKTDSSDSQVRNISCNLSPATNGDIFIQGSDILVECPSSCHQATSDVYGSRIFHIKSSVCKAAIHSGAIGSIGGKVYVKIIKGLKKYLGSLSNGVNSQDYDKSDGMNAFSINKYQAKCPIEQYKELAKQDAASNLDENKQDDSSSSSGVPSFLEMEMSTSSKSTTSTSSKVMLSQVKEKFEEDYRSNELEGVDLNDIEKAGVKTNYAYSGTNPDYNEKEDFDYNNTNNKEEPSESNETEISKTTTEGVTTDMVKDVNGMIEYNNKFQGGENNQINMSDPNFEGLKSTDLAENGMIPIGEEENFKFTQANTDSEAELSNEERNAQIDLLNNMFKDINKAKDKLTNTAQSAQLPEPKDPVILAKQKETPRDSLKSQPPNSNPTGSPSSNNSPPTSIPRPPANKPANMPAPKPGQTSPPPPNEKPKKINNSRTEPTTDDGNVIVTKIRKVVDWQYLDLIKDKTSKVKKAVNDFKKGLSWGNEGSSLSTTNIKRNLQMIEKYKIKVSSIMKKLAHESNSRISKTKKIKKQWRLELENYESKDVFKLNYSFPPEVLLKKIFRNVDAKSKIKVNWEVFTEGIKNRPKALGTLSDISSEKHLIGSLLLLNGKKYYDFNLVVDILFKSNGKAGIAFRIKDEYNYYAFYINKKKGIKAIVKVVNGRKIFIQKVTDGGILINNWHKVNIKCSASKIHVHIYDTEQTNKSTSEKIFEVTDEEFSSGKIGLFVNKMQGFYFDNLVINPLTCWTCWTPIKNLQFTTTMSSVYVEDFEGSITQKFISVEPEDSVDGPSDWTIKRQYSISNPIGIYQNSLVHDRSSNRRPAMLILKQKNIANGVLTVTFTPFSDEGGVSIVFKYFKDSSSTGQPIESFYLFEMIKNKNNSQFILRKFSNGTVKEIQAVNKKVSGLEVLGYKPSVNNKVEIEITGEKIKIRYSTDGSPLVEVINAKDLSIPYGLVGVGTFSSKVAFTALEMTPHVIQISEADKNKILSSDLDDIFIPDLPSSNENGSGNNKNNNGNKNNNNGMKQNDNNGGTTNNSGMANGKGKNDKLSNLIGMNTCITHRTVKDRNSYCELTFAIREAKVKCKENFCGTCCSRSVNKSHKSRLYNCQKLCQKSTIHDSDNTDYKSICINSENPITSVYNYCDDKLKNDEVAKKICKLDMCNLCCTTMDVMKDKLYSIDNIKKCFSDCSKEFNK